MLPPQIIDNLQRYRGFIPVAANPSSMTPDLAEIYQVEQVRKKWAWSRDYQDWEGLRECFHSDAFIEVSWYRGDRDGFIANSRALVEKRKPEERSKHWLGNQRTEINGSRALLETDAQIQGRYFVEDYLVDSTAYARFYDLLEKRDGVWRIAKWYCFFDKDRLDPVFPGSVPPEWFNDVVMTGIESSFAFMRFRQKRIGRTTISDIILGQSEREREKRAEGKAWLAGA
jgi:hypothetical protein